MRVKGIKRGQAIELFESLDSIPDGTELMVEIIAINTLKYQNH